MVAVGMVQPPIHDVIDMIPTGHAFVSAGRVVRVRTARHCDRLEATFEVPHKGHLTHGALSETPELRWFDAVESAVKP
jgi:hypothetical protein